MFILSINTMQVNYKEQYSDIEDSDVEHTDIIYEEDLLNVKELFSKIEKQREQNYKYKKYLFVGAFISTIGLIVSVFAYKKYRSENKN